MSRGDGYALFLTDDGATLSLRNGANRSETANLAIEWLGTNPNTQATGIGVLQGLSNYLRGPDPANWIRDVPHYSRVAVPELYAGIDLIYYGTPDSQLEYDFVVAPGANPDSIRWQLDGAEGVTIDPTGGLIVQATHGEVRFDAPRLYQEVNGDTISIPGGFELHDDATVSFRVGAYDTGRPLVIDPVLLYSTYIGGSQIDFATGVAVDAAGQIYVVGDTNSADFPVVDGSFDVTLGQTDVFVTKLGSDGTTLVYSTFLGGSDDDFSSTIVVDGQGSAYVGGLTLSTDYPTLSAFQGDNAGSFDGFVTKLNAAGNGLVFSTYLGGTSFDQIRELAIDATNDVYLVGTSSSTDFPTQNAFQASLNDFVDAIVAKLDAGGQSLEYSTFLGGTSNDDGIGIAVDALGRAYVVGGTDSSDFPVANAAQVDSGGFRDLFVTRFAPDGASLSYSTFLGGTGREADSFADIAIDGQNNAYVTSNTTSSDFPVVNALQPQLNGTTDAFVTKLNVQGDALVYSTYIGGNDPFSKSQGEVGVGITVDGTGSVYVVGSTSATDFPLVDPVQTNFGGGGADAFLFRLSPAGDSFIYSTILGGSEFDLAEAVVLDSTGAAILAGSTSSPDFPTLGGLTVAMGGGNDGFVARIGDSGGGGAIDVDVIEFTVDTTTSLARLEVTYSITGGDASAFAFGFFRSNNARFDAGDSESGPRLAVNAAADLTAGTHTIGFNGLSYTAFLADASAAFFLIAADVDDLIAETDETNNDRNFIGVFFSPAGAGAGIAVARGADDTDRNSSDDPNDIVNLTATGSNLTISSSLLPSPVVVPLSAMTELRLLGVGGNDSLLATGATLPLLNVSGGNGNDSFTTGGARGTVLGGNGDDTLVAIVPAVGTLVVNGQNGADQFNVQAAGAGTVQLNDSGGSGDSATLSGTAASDDVVLTTGAVRIGAASVELNGIETAILNLSDGDDRITVNGVPAVSAGGLQVLGGAGADQAFLNAITGQGIQLDLQQGNDQYFVTFGALDANFGLSDTGVDVGDQLSVFGSPFADQLVLNSNMVTVQFTPGTGSPTAQTVLIPLEIEVVVLDGAGGNDVVTAGGSVARPVTLRGGAGDDILSSNTANSLPIVADGGSGNDRVSGDRGSDLLSGGPGNDTVMGGEGDDRLDGGPDDDQLDGGPGRDTVDYSLSSVAVSVDLLSARRAAGARTRCR